MELKVKLLKWSAGVPVAMLNQKTAEKITVHPADRITITTNSKKPKEVSTIVDVSKGIVNDGEIGISSELERYFDYKIGKKVDVNLSMAPKSLDFIKKKMNNKPLSEKEINAIINDVVDNSLSSSEIALLISSISKYGTNKKETIYLVEAIRKTGSQLRLPDKIVADKHSVGGIPGNRTTPLVVSICVAAGLTMPKSSSRAITSAAGTSDVIEAVADVEFSISEVKKIIKKVGGCMVWGDGLGMVPADAKLMNVERSLSIDPESQLIASIMSKKLAVGSKYVLIDIPFGKGAKIESREKAQRIKRRFEELGKHFRMKVKCVLTNGTQPIGNGMGPMLELVDIIKILDPIQQGPKDLERKGIFLSGQLLELTGKAKKGQGETMAKEILDTGKAFEKFKQIITAQHGNLRRIKDSKFKYDIVAKKSGKVKEIENHKMNSLVRVMGSPVDKPAGVYLYFHVGDHVKKGQKVLTLHAESKSRIKEGIKFYETSNPIYIK